MSLAGLSGTFGMLYLQQAMTAGSAGWVLGQSAMLIPFALGIFFFGEQLRAGGIAGVIAIIFTLVAFAGARNKSAQSANGPANKWFSRGLAALLLLGIQQFLSSIPSSWQGWTDSSGLRVPLTLTAGVLPLIIIVCRRRVKPAKDMVSLALLYAGMIICGQLLLFKAMDYLSQKGRLSLTYPLAIGSCMLLVIMYDFLIWKNRPSRRLLAGLLSGTAGVILMAI